MAGGTSDVPAPKSNMVMGISATVAICGVLFALGKLYGTKIDDIGTDVGAIRVEMQIDNARELRDAEKFGRILARLDALEAK